MSTPLNHHFVSQCQIKQFFDNDGKIFLYDKTKENFYSRNSSKNIFSERFANSIYKNGKTDHESLENDLKLFEDRYPAAIDLITDTAKTGKISRECHHSLLDIILFGIVGRLRTPERKRELDGILDDIFNKLKPSMDEAQISEWESTQEYKKHVSYSNILGYSDTALRIAEKMGGIDFTIWHIQSDDCFLLPDTSATSIRKQINKHYNSDAKEIAEIGFPLTDKIFIHALSKKLGQGKSVIAFVDKNNNQAVTDINFNLFHAAYKTIGTSSEKYLRYIVSKITESEH